MKKTALLFTFLVCAMFTQAQYYYLPFTNNPGSNPGNLNTDDEYPVGGGLDASWTTIRSSSATPAWSTSQTIPFAFSFNGAPVTNYKVSTTGILTFDVASATAPPSSAAQALPAANIPNSSVCVWGIQGTGANDNVVVKTFGTAPNRQHWVFFTSYTIPGNATGWTYWSIVLEETTNKIYLVDQRTNGTLNMTLGIQIDNTTAYSVTGSPGINTLSTNNAAVADNNYYEFNYGTQVALDLSAIAISTNPYVAFGNHDITGTLTNLGSATITSFDINYTINGGTAVTGTINGVSIPALGTYNFTHPVQWNATVPGAYTVNVYASNPNGNTDQNPVNDAFATTINVLSQIEQRNPFFEIFTSSTCPPCTPGNINFHNIIDTIPANQHVYIKYQQDFPGTGDPYTTDESLGRRGYYSINSIPRMENDGGWDGNANSFTYSLYQSTRSKPAQYKMYGSYTEDTIARTYSAMVHYSPLFAATNSVLQTAIVENTTHLNIKTNGETEFYQVMKKMLPSDAGTTLPTVAVNAWDSVSLTYTFNGNYRLPSNGQAANIIDNSTEHSVEEFGDLAMLSWIQSPNGDKQVYQAINLTKSTLAGIYPMNASIDAINIYPSPAADFVNVDINLTANENIKITVLDISGRVIETKSIQASSGLLKQTFDVSQLTSGVYHVAVADGKNNAFVKRIVKL
jgi:hypothetical protein